MSRSAKPYNKVIIPDDQSIRLSAAHVVKDELVRVQPSTSVSSKYVVMIKVIE